MNQLDRLERLAQRLIEGPFRVFFQTRLHLADLADYLANAIENGRRNEDKTNLLPNHYHILVNSTDYAYLVERSSYDTILTELHHHLTNLVVETDERFYGPLRILLDKDDVVLPGRVEIKTDYVPAIKEEGEW